MSQKTRKASGNEVKVSIIPSPITPRRPRTPPLHVNLNEPPDPSVVTQEELERLRAMDKRLREVVVEITAYRRALAARLFGSAMIEPGPLAVIMECATATDRRPDMRRAAESPCSIETFIDSEGKPCRLELVKYDPKRDRSLFRALPTTRQDPRKINGYGYF